jgi:hypothetical protein
MEAITQRITNSIHLYSSLGHGYDPPHSPPSHSPYCATQVTGKGPLAALSEHLADPYGTTIFSKAVVVPGQAVAPPCAIPSSVQFQGITIPTPCFGQALWP